MSSRTTSGRNASGGLEGRRAVVGDPHLLPSRAAAAAWPGVRRRPRCRPPPGCGGWGEAALGALPAPAAPRPGRGSLLGRQGGQPDDELAAPARPVAVGRDRPAVHLDQAAAPGSGRSPARPATGRSAPIGLDEQARRPAAASPARCRCPCPAPGSRRPRRPPARPSAGSGPPGSVYLAALFSRLPRTCSSRVGSASRRTGSVGQVDASARAGAPR